MQPLADLGYNVIAVDYRGAGDSNHPSAGYDKMTMAKDIHSLYHDKLGIDKAIVLGTDIGSMVAVSLALQFEDDVLALVTGGESWRVPK
jgi:pimeloyl-ACP methyl ester carboxylesterase